MALQSQVWSPATPMPMAESSLYRQRLEVIAEKRRLQEAIGAAHRELEEEKLRVERLKRKSLRERWLMDGAAEGLERPEGSSLKDPPSPEDQAQARIRNLEDSLFTLQSQLQLLQSASTGAQHKPSGRLTWRRQGHRPLSQPIVEASSAGHPDLNKRASLPAGPVGTSPESPSELRDEAVGVLPAPGRVPGAAGASSEANGPCPGPSPSPGGEPHQGVAALEGGMGDAKGGGVVQVVWEGLRAAEDSATGPTDPELEAQVEEMVLEAIGERQETSRPELPSWVKVDRGVVEVVWEGMGGPEGSNSEVVQEAGRGQEALQSSSLRLQGAASGAGAPRGIPDGDGPGGSGGEEGSFIWVERVTLSEEWEELVVEGLDRPRVQGREGAAESLLGVEGRAGETCEGERSQAEEPVGTGEQGSEEKAGAELEGAERLLAVGRKGSADSSELERRGGEEKLGTQREGVKEPLLGTEREGVEEPLTAVEGPLGAEGEGGVEPLAVEQKGEQMLGAQKEAEGPLGAEKGDEEKLQATEDASVTERKEGEESQSVDRTGGEEASEAEKAQEIKEDQTPEQQRESGGGKKGQAEEVREGGAPLGAKEELRPEEEGTQPQEKQEGSLEEEAAMPQTPAEGQGPSGDPTTLLAETPAPEQPTECQPLLHVEGPRANPSAHPVPTYAPARQPEPSAPPEGEEASGPKQKTCQCCVVM
ncbi:paralemmin-3 [Manis pentadactyla]|uniref:paralemmin-3 n=1 Tax=Manis pentadactyla TaxID=143292 RepID=UPI00255CC1D4|nr:paralemmin-3 [Manis pentadactyla]